MARSAAARAHLHPLGLPRSANPQAPSPAAGRLRPSPPGPARAPTRSPPAPPPARRSRSWTPTTTPRPKPTCAPTTKPSRCPRARPRTAASSRSTSKAKPATCRSRKPSANSKRRAKEAKPKPKTPKKPPAGGSRSRSTSRPPTPSASPATSSWSRPTNPSTSTSKPPSTPPRPSARPRSPTPTAAPRKAALAHEVAGPFNHAGTVITASAGDNGYLDWNSGLGAVEFPAASPHVVAVGGTRLKLGAGSSWSGRDDLERRRRRRRRLQHDLRSPQLAAVAVQLVGGRMLRERARSRTSPPTRTPTPAWPCRTRPARNAKRATRKPKSNTCCTGARSAAPASPRRSSPRCSPSREAAAASPIPPPRCTRTRSPRPTALHDVTSGSNGECPEPFNPSNGISGCTHRTGGGAPARAIGSASPAAATTDLQGSERPPA